MADQMTVEPMAKQKTLEPSETNLHASRRTRRQRLWSTFFSNKPAILGAMIVGIVLFAAVFADSWILTIFTGGEPQPLLARYDPTLQDPANRLAGPSAEHWMGLDDFGRDQWSRVIHGARVSIAVGFGAVAIGGAVGTLLGVAAGYLGGWVENVLMRVVDTLMAFPSLIMGLMVLAALGGGLVKMIIAIGIVISPTFARVSHSATLSVKQNEYVEAARALGVSDFNIARRHVLTNIVSELVVLGSIWTAAAIRTEASLSFIGLGVSPPTSAWGSMIRNGTDVLSVAPWVSLFPGVAILLAVVGFNLLGDGLRDVLDPKLQE